MSYLGKKLGSFADNALERINELSRTRDGQSVSGNNRPTTVSKRGHLDGNDGEELEALRVITPATSPTADLYRQQYSGVPTNRTARQIGFQFNRGPFGGGIPFGGDLSSSSNNYYNRPPPAIGFRADFDSIGEPIERDKEQTDAKLKQLSSTIIENNDQTTTTTTTKSTENNAQQQNDEEQEDDEKSVSETKRICYFLPRIWFLMFTLCLMRLVLFVCKVYEDFQATKHYNLTGLTGHFLISAATLILPTLVFTIYRVARYLQTRNDFLPSTMLITPPTVTTTTKATTKATNREGVEDHSQSSSPTQADDEGLVTARQTPTNVQTSETFHDSEESQKQQHSEQDDGREVVINGGEGSEEREREKEKVEAPRAPARHVRMDVREAASSLQQAPEAAKTTTTISTINSIAKSSDNNYEIERSIIIGVGEQILHGMLFIFWQLKRQVDVLSYLIGRACVWRTPNSHEDEQLTRLQIDSDGLEWFQDFYAAFLAILTQVYSLGLYWFRDSIVELPVEATSENLGTPLVNDKGFFKNNLSKVLANSSRSLEFKDLIVISELLVSSAVVLSLLVVVRRRDDGPLTRLLSSIGWGSLFAARIIVISLAFVHLGWRLIFPLTLAHIFLVALWIYKISLDSHNDKAGERLHEAEWDEQVRNEVESQLQREQQQRQQQEATTIETTAIETNTNKWTLSMHLVLLTQILTLFAIPSLFYWPIMFNLRLHLRPLKYLLIVLVQNFLLISGIWYKLSSPTAGQLYLLGAVGGLTIVGFIFVALYVALKPDFTEYFVRADMEFNQAEQAGVYYEFCSRVFKMPDLAKHSFSRLMKQEEREEEIE